ncbi:MAG: hypothetical protein COA42_19185 [Alteromonadaceae bacterium]|nr:MAG: hypothetical protein COA42_19185 [Alteromonadaceae bacterium]
MSYKIAASIILLLSSNVSFAQGVDEGVQIFGLILSVPAFVIMGFLFFYVRKSAKKAEFHLVKMAIICFVVLIPGGISFQANWTPFPNWASFVEGDPLRPLITAFVLCFPFLGLYRLQWKKRGGKIQPVSEQTPEE